MIKCKEIKDMTIEELHQERSVLKLIVHSTVGVNPPKPIASEKVFNRYQSIISELRKRS